jgi:arylsulfatase A-like enzyme
LPVTYRTERKTGAAFPSPFSFRKHGRSGIDVSELFPRVAESADRLCVIRSMQTDVPNHEPSLLMMNCGDARLPRPSFGSWVTYGLGSENQNLPGFVVLCPNGYPVQGTDNWRAAFLPGAYQGTYIETRSTNVEKLIENIRHRHSTPAEQKRQLALLATLNRQHQAARREDLAIEARIQSFELAARMQLEAVDAFDIRREPAHVRDMYGDTTFGRQTLIARRLIEKGVRMVQVWHGALIPWDSHSNLAEAHRSLAGECDQPIGALLKDLARRGMLDDTLVLWGGEFGRTPTVELSAAGSPANGRDHNPYGFTVWLAGGGVKGGQVYGATDEFGFRAVEKPVHVHDLHATLLHLLGFDHEKLTYRYAGRDFRLTDVHGNVVHEILA